MPEQATANNSLSDKPVNNLDLVKAVRLRLRRNLTYQEIADKLGVPKSTVYDRINEVLGLIDDPEANQAYHSNMVSMLRGAERVLIGHMLDPGRLKKASVNNLAYAFQQIHNARRLESGLSTENVDVMVQYEAVSKERQQQARAAQKIRQRLIELGADPDQPGEQEEIIDMEPGPDGYQSGGPELSDNAI